MKYLMVKDFEESGTNQFCDYSVALPKSHEPRPRHRRGTSLISQNENRDFFQDEILKFPQMENLISERENKLIARDS